MSDSTLTLELDPAADALLDRIAEAAGKSKAEVAAEALSHWLAATINRLDGGAALSETLQRLGEAKRDD